MRGAPVGGVCWGCRRCQRGARRGARPRPPRLPWLRACRARGRAPPGLLSLVASRRLCDAAPCPRVSGSGGGSSVGLVDPRVVVRDPPRRWPLWARAKAERCRRPLFSSQKNTYICSQGAPRARPGHRESMLEACSSDLSPRDGPPNKIVKTYSQMLLDSRLVLVWPSLADSGDGPPETSPTMLP